MLTGPVDEAGAPMGIVWLVLAGGPREVSSSSTGSSPGPPESEAAGCAGSIGMVEPLRDVSANAGRSALSTIGAVMGGARGCVAPLRELVLLAPVGSAALEVSIGAGAISGPRTLGAGASTRGASFASAGATFDVARPRSEAFGAIGTFAEDATGVARGTVPERGSAAGVPAVGIDAEIGGATRIAPETGGAPAPALGAIG